jgi:hypothetical protein
MNNKEKRRHTAEFVGKLWNESDRLVSEAGKIVLGCIHSEVQLAGDKENPRNIKFDLNDELRDVVEAFRTNYILIRHYSKVLGELDALVAEEQK